MWALVYFLVIVAVSVYAMSLAPKPQNAKPVGLSDFTVPTAEVGRELPVLFGRRKFESPNCVWYGDLKSTPVKKKV
jgi:hypothetical protein